MLREAVLVTPRFTTWALPPLQLRVGDRVLHANGEWEVIGGPWSMTAGETVYVFIQRSGNPGTKRELGWAAHEKITVRRKGTKGMTGRAIAAGILEPRKGRPLHMKTPRTLVALLVVVTASFFLLGGENTVVPARALAADVDGQYLRKDPAARPRPAHEPERPTKRVGLDHRVAIIGLMMMVGAPHSR